MPAGATCDGATDFAKRWYEQDAVASTNVRLLLQDVCLKQNFPTTAVDCKDAFFATYKGTKDKPTLMALVSTTTNCDTDANICKIKASGLLASALAVTTTTDADKPVFAGIAAAARTVCLTSMTASTTAPLKTITGKDKGELLSTCASCICICICIHIRIRLCLCSCI